MLMTGLPVAAALLFLATEASEARVEASRPVCGPESIDDVRGSRPKSVRRHLETAQSIAAPGVGALSLGPGILVPVPDLPLAGVMVVAHNDSLGIVVLRFAGPSEPRVTINYAANSTLAAAASQFGVSPSQLIEDYVIAPGLPNCGDKVAVIHHALSEVGLALAIMVDTKRADVVWNEAPLRISAVATTPANRLARSAVVEIDSSQGRIVAIDWSESALQNEDLSGLITGHWIPQSGVRQDLEELSSAIAVGSYEAVLAAGSRLAAACLTKIGQERLACGAALTMLERERTGRDHSASEPAMD